MYGHRRNRRLANPAIAAAVALSVIASLPTRAEDEAASPRPHSGSASTPGAGDAITAAKSPPTSAEIEAKIPIPESADMAPPSLADIGNPSGAARMPELADEAVMGGASVPTSVDVAPSLREIGQQAPLVVAIEDAALVEALRDAIQTKLARFVERKSDRSAIEAFYSGRGFAPVWIEDRQPNARVKAARAYLAGVDAEGLDPVDYSTPVIKAGAEPSTLADAELRMTAAILRYARHAQTGRARIDADISYSQESPEPGTVLTKVVDATDVGHILATYNPPHDGYKKLKAKLAEMRGQKSDAGSTHIGSGPLLKVAMGDSRVPLLRQRLRISGDGNILVYDRAVAGAVKNFQQQRGLSPTGQLDSATIDALNAPRHDREADIVIANMERWRWMPRDLGTAYTMLNIPDFTLKVVRDGKEIWRTKVVVGKPSTPTPILSDAMKFITVNPIWNVPPSIVNNEYLPALQRDPTVLARMGLEVAYGRDGGVRISQPPGDRNALGRIRFNFPNKFLVYQHDTPDKHLFGQEKRAYSHGCMRVQDPLKYAEILLSIARPKEHYTPERLRKMFGPSEININFATHIPVHITYQTAFVDDAGKLVVRGDIYGRDSQVLAVLKDHAHRIAGASPERPRHAQSARPTVRSPQRFDDLSLFERFFR